MKQQLEFLQSVLEEIDSDPTKSAFAAYHPDMNKILIQNLLGHNAYEIHNDIALAKQQVDDSFLKLDNFYSQNQDLCWRSHEQHFHTSFKEYIVCPMISLCEITEFLSKLQRRIYAA